MARTKAEAMSPLFKWILKIAVAFIVISLLTSIGISFCPNPSDMQITLFQNCMDAWKMGIAAIVGLIGGRAEPK